MPRKEWKPADLQDSMRWEFEPDIPTHDFLEEGPLDNSWNLQLAIDDFANWVEKDKFLTWEAVVCKEQGFPLTAEQKKALGSLLSFCDEDDEQDDQVLYIDEIPRPSEPWYVILNRIAPYLLVEPFRTFDAPDETKINGWQQIMGALKEHGHVLSLPPDVASYRDVVPADLRHKLWLQDCFEDLGGLGQAPDLTLADPKEHYRIDRFIDHLRECKESVAHFGLTLESLLTRMVLPEKDQLSSCRRCRRNLA